MVKQALLPSQKREREWKRQDGESERWREWERGKERRHWWYFKTTRTLTWQLTESCEFAGKKSPIDRISRSSVLCEWKHWIWIRSLDSRMRKYWIFNHTKFYSIRTNSIILISRIDDWVCVWLSKSCHNISTCRWSNRKLREMRICTRNQMKDES